MLKKGSSTSVLIHTLDQTCVAVHYWLKYTHPTDFFFPNHEECKTLPGGPRCRLAWGALPWREPAPWCQGIPGAQGCAGASHRRTGLCQGIPGAQGCARASQGHRSVPRHPRGSKNGNFVLLHNALHETPLEMLFPGPTSSLPKPCFYQ